MLKSLTQIVGRLDQVAGRLEADAREGASAFRKRVFELYRANEESITAIGNGLLDLYRGWPKHPGTGRSLQLEEISPWYAASQAVDRQVYRKNRSKELETVLRDRVQLKRVGPEEIEALWRLVRERNSEPIDPDLWDAEKALAYLRTEVPKRANKIRKARRLEDRARGFFQVPFRRLFPEYYRPAYFGEPQPPGSKRNKRKERKPGVKRPPAHNPEDASGGERQIFDGEEDRASFLKAAGRFLPPRRRDVLRLRLQDLSDEEIASKLGIAQSTVRAHKRALRNHPAMKRLVRRWFGVG